MTAGAPSATAAASATAGAAIAGAVMTTALGFVGFFAGIIFLAIAYGLKTRVPA